MNGFTDWVLLYEGIESLHGLILFLSFVASHSFPLTTIYEPGSDEAVLFMYSSSNQFYIESDSTHVAL